MSGQMRESLVIDALGQAVGREEPGPVFHDGQSTRYTTKAFQRARGRHGITQSVSRPGNPYGNAVAESFFATLKNEMYYRESFATRDAAKMAVIEFIESYYNRKRPHSSIDYRIPAEAMDAFFERTKPMEKAIAMAA